MDRLISEQAVLDTISEWIALGEYNYTNATEYLRKRIKVIPSAEPYKGMTNGEVIETLFPNADIEYRKISVYVTISPLTNLVIFDKDWWNSPYEPQERK